jgi:hypothetical protein
MPNATTFLAGSPNLSFNERAISVVAGLGLAAAGVKPRPNPLLNVLALLGGAYLAYRGATGHCPVKAAIEDAGGLGRLTGGSSSGSLGSGASSGSTASDRWDESMPRSGSGTAMPSVRSSSAAPASY